MQKEEKEEILLSVLQKVEEVKRKKVCRANFGKLLLPQTEEESEEIAFELESILKEDSQTSSQAFFDSLYEKLAVYEKSLAKIEEQFQVKKSALEEEKFAFERFIDVLLRADRNLTKNRLQEVFQKEERFALYGLHRTSGEIHLDSMTKLRYGILELMIEENNSPKTKEQEAIFAYREQALILDTRLEEQETILKEAKVIPQNTVTKMKVLKQKRENLMMKNVKRAAK